MLVEAGEADQLECCEIDRVVQRKLRVEATHGKQRSVGGRERDSPHRRIVPPRAEQSTTRRVVQAGAAAVPRHLRTNRKTPRVLGEADRAYLMRAR